MSFRRCLPGYIGLTSSGLLDSISLRRSLFGHTSLSWCLLGYVIFRQCLFGDISFRWWCTICIKLYETISVWDTSDYSLQRTCQKHQTTELSPVTRQKTELPVVQSDHGDITGLNRLLDWYYQAAKLSPASVYRMHLPPGTHSTYT